MSEVRQEVDESAPIYESLKEALRRDAKHHVEAGTVKLPIDPEEFASRIEKGPVGALVLAHEDCVRAITEVCDELGIARVPQLPLQEAGEL